MQLRVLAGEAGLAALGDEIREWWCRHPDLPWQLAGQITAQAQWPGDALLPALIVAEQITTRQLHRSDPPGVREERQPVDIIERQTPYYTAALAQARPIAGIVVHDTETTQPATPHPDGSWHYQLCRDGTVYREVAEASMAWHVRAADRWRPAWVRPSQAGVSDVNYCTIGIELVSDASYRAAGEPYTEVQYATLRALLGLLWARYGTLPVVGHGELQRDRSDPVAFDWTQSGLGPLVVTTGGHWPLGLYDGGETAAVLPAAATAEQAENGDTSVTDDERAALALLHDLGAGSASIAAWINELGALREANAALAAQVQLAAQRGHLLCESRPMLKPAQLRALGRELIALAG